LHSFSRKTHGFNQFTFLSVNYPVNFNPEKTPLSSPKGPALGAKTSLFRPFVALRLRPLDKCRPLAHPCGDWGETIPVWKGQLCAIIHSALFAEWVEIQAAFSLQLKADS
jgi:hypothetical protein